MGKQRCERANNRRRGLDALKEQPASNDDRRQDQETTQRGTDEKGDEFFQWTLVANYEFPRTGSSTRGRLRPYSTR
jgi:hypothetical protein